MALGAVIVANRSDGASDNYSSSEMTRDGSWRGFTNVLAITSAAALTACGGASDQGDLGGVTDDASAQIAHVHGLGVNPADGALFIATHSGLFRSTEGSSRLETVGGNEQDTMGFTVVGANEFLGSGHPAPDQPGPTSLGLIESGDAGENWSEVSLGGEADFHVLRSLHGRVYGYNGLTGMLMVSRDGGETWVDRVPPAPMIDLAVDPEDPERLIASTENGLALSVDDGRSWKPLSDEVGLLAWPEAGTLFLIDARGEVQHAADPEGSWKRVGAIGGQPSALAASGKSELFAALADATILTSRDGGASWSERVSP